jgi:hypothetical protein
VAHAGSNLLQSYLAVVLASVHSLSDAEFSKFADQFLVVLREADGDVEKLNSLRDKTAREPSQYQRLNLSFGSSLLLQIFENPYFFDRNGLELSTDQTRLQRARIVTLVARALGESTVFSDQESRIVKGARGAINQGHDFGLVHRSPEVLNGLRAIVSSSAARSARKCAALFETIPSRPSRMPQWP